MERYGAAAAPADPDAPSCYAGPPVRRLIIAIALALLLGQVLAPQASAGLEVCIATCPDDGPDGRCSPACFDCGCCGHAGRNQIAPHASPQAVTDPARWTAAGAGPRLPTALQKDVFHVPKFDLA
jgi:hypothetical protein